MDSFTHIVLGGAIGQAFFGRRLGKWAFVIGAVAATVPDLDVFIHTGNAVNDHLIHRYFSHALLLAPVLAGITTAGFMLRKSLRPHALLIYLLCLIAVFSHIFLDACTSYGTLLLWPFAEQRAALDLVAVVDVFFTGILVAGVIVAWRRKSALAARVALVAALAYLGLAAVQHERALETQQQLIARRGQLDASNPRAIPQLGTTLNFRTLYLSGGKIFVDAVRVPPLEAVQVRAGSSLEQVVVQDLQPFPASDSTVRDFDRMEWFADGFLARAPEDPKVLADMRYTATPDGFDPIWGLQLEGTAAPEWHNFVGRRNVSRLWKEFIRPNGYAPLGATVP